MRNKTFLTTAVLAALLATAPLASAQNRQRWPGGGGGGGNRGGEQRGGGEQRSGGGEQRSGGAEQRAGGGDRQRGGDRQAQPRDGGRDQARDNDRGQARPAPQVQRNDGDRRADGRNDGRNGRYEGRNDGRDGRYATPRTGPVPRYRDGDRRVYVQPRRNYYVYRYPSYRYGSPRYYGYRYYDPYFSGDFFWSNHAWTGRTSYYGGSWDNDLGKLRLDIDQRDAEVYIDGYYAGVIDDFDGRLQGLRLEPGNYQVEVALPGFEPLEFDVHITPGRTTTYRGSLLPE